MAVTYGAIIQFALVVASVIYSRQQAKKAKRALSNSLAASGGYTITSRDAAASRRIIYGTQRVGGVYAYMVASGSKNEYLHLVIMLAGHKVHAIRDIYFDDKLVELNAGGIAIGGLNGAEVYVEKHLGEADQLASRALIEALGHTQKEVVDGVLTDVFHEGEWTSEHRLRGIAYIYVKLKYDSDKFTGLPNISAVVDGKEVYDPRTGATAFSQNPALCWRDYMTDKICGLASDNEEIDDDSVIVAANICDEQVGILGDVLESRYACDGCIDMSMRPADVLDDFMSCMAGWAIYTGGLWNLRAGAHQIPAAHFTIDDMRGEVQLQASDSVRDTCNAVKGVYISPLNKWQPTDFPPVKNRFYYEQDNNERIWRDVEYPFTISSAGAQRLAKIELEQARQDVSCKVQLKLCGLRVKAGDVIELTVERYGWVRKQFEVTAWKFVVDNAGGSNTGAAGGDSAPVLGVDLELRETAAGVWDWNTGEETRVDLAPNVNLPDPLASPNPSNLVLSSGNDVLIRGNDGSIVSRILATWTLSPSQFVQSGGRYEIEYKRSDAADWMPGGSVAGYMPRAFIDPVEDGVAYDVRIRSVNQLGAAGEWVVAERHIVVGKTAAPSAPKALKAGGAIGGVVLSWENSTDADLRGVEIFEGENAAPAPSADTAATAFVYANSWTRGGLADGDIRFYWVRSVDTSGNRSAWVGPESARSGSGVPVMPDVPVVQAMGGYGQIVASWSQSNLSSVRYWEVFVSDKAGDAPMATRTGVSSAILVLSGLGGAVTRYVRVRAVGAGDLISDWSAESNATTMQVDTEQLRGEVDQIKDDLQAMGGDLAREVIERKQAVAAIADEMGNYATLAALTEEKLLRASVDEALARDIAKTIAVMNDSVAAVIHESEARVTTLNAMARDLASVIAILGDNHAAVQVLTEAYVDAAGLAIAKWGLTLDAGGVITGIEATAQNGTQPVSEVKVLASVFKIVSMSGANGEVITPFMVKDGKVYINTAYIAEASIKGAHIDKLQVDTLHIKNQAVTVPVSAFTSSEIHISLGQTSVVQSVVIDRTPGSPLFLAFSSIYKFNDYTDYVTPIKVVRNDTVVVWQDVMPGVGVGSNTWFPYGITFLDTDTTGGVCKYDIIVTANKGINNSGYVKVRSRSLFLLETKK